MPYSDPERKREWELQHRSRRLARRRELRRIQAAHNPTEPVAPQVEGSGAGVLWLPVGGGAVLASYHPKFAMGAGGLTLLLAGLYKKGWIWWVAGAVILTIGVLFQWNQQDTKK
jgi:hypothetical protein